MKASRLLPLPPSRAARQQSSNILEMRRLCSLSSLKISWPFPCGPAGKFNDLTVFNLALGPRIRGGKLVIADGVYQHRKVAKPDSLESKKLKNFKSRVRLLQETFNGRLNKFEALNQIFRHGVAKHKLAFEAICVICQNAMDNGSELFDA